MHKAVQNILKQICLAALLVVATFGPKTMAHAADAVSATLDLPSLVAKAGDTVDLDLTIADNPGIIGMTLEVNYDSRLTLTKIENGDAFKALEMTKPGALEPGCRIHWDAVDLDTSDVKDGVVATLTFVVADDVPAGTSCFVRVVGVTENGKLDVYDTELNTVDLQAASGTVSTEPEEQPQPVLVTGVSLDEESLAFTESGQTRQLKAQVTPEDASDATVTWSSSDEAVATVSEGGFVTAVANGQATITATTKDGSFTATCTVTVDIPESIVTVTGITLDQPTLNLSALGETVKLTVTVEPSDATDSSVRWASSDESIATVSDDGLVTAVAEGVTTIMVSTVDGGYMQACVVTVAIPKPAVAFDDVNIVLDHDSFAYTGKAQVPGLTVTFDGEELLQDIDYVVSCENNVNVGQANMTVTGRGRYEGERAFTFDIVPVSLDGLTVTFPKTQTYTGKKLTPAVTVRFGDKKLVSGTDFTVSYKNNVKPGKATIMVEGKGNFTGTVTGGFTIGKVNPLAAKAKKKAVNAKLSVVKKKALVLASNVKITKKGIGAISYANASTNKVAKKFKVNAKNGKITVPKGTKKGTYAVKVKVIAKGNKTYLKGEKIVTFKVKVK